jgi:hypothetical protein
MTLLLIYSVRNSIFAKVLTVAKERGGRFLCEMFFV